MKIFDVLLFSFVLVWGFVGLVLGVIGLFDDTPLRDALGSCAFGLGMIAGGIYYKKWIFKKIEEEAEQAKGN